MGGRFKEMRHENSCMKTVQRDRLPKSFWPWLDPNHGLPEPSRFWPTGFDRARWTLPIVLLTVIITGSFVQT
jgi:hypothetical protein